MAETTEQVQLEQRKLRPVDIANQVLDQAREMASPAKRLIIGAALGLSLMTAACSPQERDIAVPQPIIESSPRPTPTKFEDLGLRYPVGSSIERKSLEIVRGTDQSLQERASVSFPSEIFDKPSAILTPEANKRGYRMTASEGRQQFEPSAAVPEEILEDILSTINPINQLLPHESNRLRHIELYSIDFNQYQRRGFDYILNGYPDHDKKAMIILVSPDRPIPIEELRIIAFHEMVHIFHNLSDIRGLKSSSPELMSINTILQEDRRKVMGNYIQQLIDRGESEAEIIKSVAFGSSASPVISINPLFNVVEESSYSGGYLGHPYDNYGELIADTTTVMHFFPDSFMATVDKLDPDDKAVFFRLGNSIIDFFRRNSSDPSQADELFSPQLLAFLQQSDLGKVYPAQ